MKRQIELIPYAVIVILLAAAAAVGVWTAGGFSAP